ncbi:MAG: HlyD family efflux transporter periplasmic adaptor subunit [Scytonema sp. PMC 1069.18]|nr:HlyD family efflux transporter periplasmic adaptor subunit [Scytonema sp. PMC 1069.18]MEC4880882.1 HlyD family efflux transporter periplasmic adaptor subunit [Scytonema sp. PMC 1070.18]
MPIPSHNSSSVVPQQEAEQYENYTQPQKYAEVPELAPSSDPTNKIDDWHYGTEELLDALPRPWTRSVLYVMLGLSLTVLPWSMVSKIDETGSARGRIEPKGATQKLDSPALGTVNLVRVKEGENVTVGQVLLELESDVLKTELEQIQEKLLGLQNQKANIKLLQNQLKVSLGTQQQQNQAQELVKQSQVEQARQNLNALKTAYQVQQEEAQAKVNRIEQALDSSKAAYKLAEVRLQAAQEKVPRYKRAFDEGVMSQDRFKEVEQAAKENYERLIQAKTEVSQAQQSLKEQQSNYQKTLYQAQSEIQQAELRLQEEQRSYQSLIHTGKLAELKAEEQLKELETQHNTLESEIAQTKTQIASLKIQLGQRVVRSPINGVIFDLPITKPGAVVQPGQRVAQIAPKNAGVVLKASMPIQDSGFLKKGMPVKVKFDAYPFQEYGIVSGKVTWISPDSKLSETPQGNIENFELEIALDRDYIQNGAKRIPLAPGQTATAEVIIRQRRVIDLILDPFKKLQTNGLEL